MIEVGNIFNLSKNYQSVKDDVGEIHLFIIWQQALNCKDKILIDLAQKFRVIEVIEIDWNAKDFEKNLSRFYGVKLDSVKLKADHCGRGKFILITVFDKSPYYQMCHTSRGGEVVNKNIFDLKEKYRNWTGGGHKIHATNSIKEVDHNLCLILGLNYADYTNYVQRDLSKNNETFYRSIAQQTFGINGWQSLNQLFYLLNSCVDYVVLRNFNTLPNYKADVDGDIDLLVKNFEDSLLLMNAAKVTKFDYRVQCQVSVAGELILFDLRHLGDNYYCDKFELDILTNRQLNDNKIYVPSAIDHFYSLLYHVLIHKEEISEKNIPQLLNYQNLYLGKSDEFDSDLCFEALLNFMKQREYTFARPNDKSVLYKEALTKKYDLALLNIMQSLDIIDITYYKVTLWGRKADVSYYKATNKIGEKFFIKRDKLAGYKEYQHSTALYNINKTNFIKPIFYRDGYLVCDFVEGITLDKVDFTTLDDKTIDVLVNDLFAITKSLKQARILHRDIRLQNIIFANDRLYLIDLQYAVSLDRYKEHKLLSQNYKMLKGLGDDYKPKDFVWNDAYSIYCVMKIICRDFEKRYGAINDELQRMMSDKSLTIKRSMLWAYIKHKLRKCFKS